MPARAAQLKHIQGSLSSVAATILEIASDDPPDISLEGAAGVAFSCPCKPLM